MSPHAFDPLLPHPQAPHPAHPQTLALNTLPLPSTPMNPPPESPSLCPVAHGTLCLILVRGLKAPDDQSKAEGAKGCPLRPPLTEPGGPFMNSTSPLRCDYDGPCHANLQSYWKRGENDLETYLNRNILKSGNLTDHTCSLSPDGMFTCWALKCFQLVPLFQHVECRVSQFQAELHVGAGNQMGATCAFDFL